MISDTITEEGQSPNFETWENRVNSLFEFILRFFHYCTKALQIIKYEVCLYKSSALSLNHLLHFSYLCSYKPFVTPKR